MNTATTPTTDLLALCARILAALERLTPEQFARGGDRPIRAALALVLAQNSGPARN